MEQVADAQRGARVSEIRARIQILDDTTANQIAAGEVVERPASAVKELVENSLDAGAGRVLVELEEGGKYLIRVTDDGCGMGSEDAVLALQRHATSKISTSEDLFRITTMGFRGEALPSIASVSRLTLTTRLADAAVDAPGFELRCEGGAIAESGEVGARPGTCITVEDLFYNVPARLKFLKSTSTELGHIIDLIQRFALAYPEVAFRLTHDGREVFTAKGASDIAAEGTYGPPQALVLDACVQVYGREIARQLAPISYLSGSLAVTGYIGTPPTLRTTRSGQHTFVNRRFVRSRSVTRALDEAYKSVQTIHGTKFPPAVILIAVDPALVDVNVSPTKTEVRFTRDGEVYSAVYHGVREALLAGGLVATMGDKRVNASSHGMSVAATLLSVPASPPVRTRTDRLGRWSSPATTYLLPGPYEDGTNPPEHGAPDRTNPVEVAASAWAGAGKIAEPPAVAYAAAPGAGEPLGSCRPQRVGDDYRGRIGKSTRVLGQTRNTYILAQTDAALLVIDQHIAHERILYEKLTTAARTGSILAQRLILPLTIELGRREAMVVEKRLAELAQAGFELEPFGGEAFVVRSVPATVAQKRLKAQNGPEAVLREIIDEMVEKSASRRLLLPAEEVLITASCKMAVKAGDPLSIDEMQALVDDLFHCENPYTCPHGRPILLELPNGELDRKFGR